MLLERLHVAAPVVVMPFGISLPPRASDPTPLAAPTLAFVGSHHHPPNADALRYLVDHLMPRVWNERRTLKDLDQLVLRAVAADAGERFQTAEQLRDALFATLAERSPMLSADRLGNWMRELFADGETPVGIYRKLAEGRPGTFLLESAEQGGIWSRYSFVGVASHGVLTERDDRVEWLDYGLPRERALGEASDLAPLAALEALYERWATEDVPGAPPLTGGLVESPSPPSSLFLEKGRRPASGRVPASAPGVGLARSARGG